MDLLRRGNEKQFEGFCKALRANKQPHIVEQYFSRMCLTPTAGACAAQRSELAVSTTERKVKESKKTGCNLCKYSYSFMYCECEFRIDRTEIYNILNEDS
jgi:hypothetical protein